MAPVLFIIIFINKLKVITDQFFSVFFNLYFSLASMTPLGGVTNTTTVPFL